MRILCWFGWHNFACSIKELINEFGYVPLDNRMPPNSKCKRCGKKFKKK